ncbi:6-bladed beta-propeller [Sunxiuqinia elliptica]|uniref:6-bladed beta-propeller protein n=1 Tax=Sunxiuqinia elliptica TaxID=655355 RepID=A0A4R6GUF9_9BACT|nr:6-bladed beta-propeller [Sunxiuqinia elliptica]TDN98953.1 6-bladed beta-propeller protein [Sunxiuqinia elliptica]TDO56394.1 6-bladed beta-propeller protein [Sunxiuqinia elliptica]
MKLTSSMKRAFFWIISFFIIAGCNLERKADDNNGDLQKIDIEKALVNRLVNNVSLKEFIDTIKYIPLETNPDCNINEIQKIEYYKDNYYLWDYNSILKFNAQGRFVCKIGNKGKGPKEYIQNRGIVIHSDTLFVNSGHKIVAFNTKNGNFLASYPFPSRIFFEKTEKSFVTFDSNTGFIECIDNNGKTLDSLNYEKFNVGEIYSDMIIYPFHNIFFGTQESLKISTSHNDTIFELNNKHKLVPRYIADLGKYKLPDDERLEYSGDFKYFEKATKKFVRPAYLETTDFLFIQFGKWLSDCNLTPFGLADKKADMIGLGLFDKNNEELSIISQDIENYPCFYPHFSDGGNSVISFVDAIEAIDFYEKNKNDKNLCKSFTTAIRHLQIEDNPILIIAKLKE